MWFNDSDFNSTDTYDFANCKINVIRVRDISFFKNIDDDKNIIFLLGGILTDYGINVAGAGDVVKSNSLKELTKVFSKVDSNTIVVIVEKDVEE